MTHIVDNRNIAGLRAIADRRARWARIMSGATLVCMAIAVVGSLWVWLDPELVRGILAPHIGLAGHPVAVTPAVQLAGIALSAPPLALLIYLLLQARAVFSGFATGISFSDLVATRVRRIGLILVIKGLLSPLWRAAAGVILTLANPQGQKVIAITIGLDDILWAIVGGLLVAIGWTLGEAARIAEENASFV
ncbi:DUF2975 domain-containing protein [Phreatobacter stygius]|uniref:DUF2975 domain-containing protein n=1 Tax=Phreatobacter stygius TaxID=1940610 RepID=A0A4D7B4S8_9HYPH|nr:DUF2975 domain-containing protein [Phreatobacter stygius]QCI63027.1 DUF2975 domain-containing protein [Phreatobacter stygius]